jgi:hypothetical protein
LAVFAVFEAVAAGALTACCAAGTRTGDGACGAGDWAEAGITPNIAAIRAAAPIARATGAVRHRAVALLRIPPLTIR